MNEYLRVTAKSISDGYNLVMTRSFQIEQIEQLLISNPALGNLYTRRQLLDAGDSIVESKLGISASKMANLGLPTTPPPIDLPNATPTQT